MRQLAPAWPVQGTTGYEFLNDVDDVFLDPAGFAEIERYYRRLRRIGATTFHDIARAGKQAALDGTLRPDVASAVALLHDVARAAGHRWTIAELTTGVIEFISALPVYRTEVAPRAAMQPADRAVIKQTSHDASPPDTPNTITAFISDVLLGAANSAESDPKLAFAQRLQQVSGPASAKGVEDTALYVYVPLASRNEVGGAPDRPLDDAVDRFHAGNVRRAQRWPVGLVTTNTHDAKRSGDIRSRLAALSEVPHEWQRAVHRWRRLNAKHRRTVRGRIAPDTNTEYLFYQTLIALWPAPRAGASVRRPPRSLVERRRANASHRAHAQGGARSQDPHELDRAGRRVRARASRASSRPCSSRVTMRRFCRTSLDSSRMLRRSPLRTRWRVWFCISRRPARRTSIRATSSGTSRSSIRTTAGRSTTTRERSNSASYRRPRPRCAKARRLTCTRTISSSW